MNMLKDMKKRVKVIKIEDIIISKLKEILYNEFIIFCREKKISRKKLIRNFNHPDALVINYSMLLHHNEELQREWLNRECRIIFPFFIRFVKHEDIEEYRFLRGRFFRYHASYYHIEKIGAFEFLYPYSRIIKSLNYSLFKRWHNGIYMVASKVKTVED